MTRGAVVITGIGVLTPAGNTVDSLWDALLTGESTAQFIDRFDASAHPIRIGCQVPVAPAPAGVSEKQLRRLDPFARFGLTAALDAFTDAGSPQTDPGRTSILVGNAVGDAQPAIPRASALPRAAPDPLAR